MWGRLFLAGGVALTTAGSSPLPVVQDVTVPPNVQVVMLSRVFEFDRAFQDRAGDEVVVAVLVQRLHRSSLNTAREFMEAAAERNDLTIGGIPARFVELELEEPARLDEVLREIDADIAVMTPLRTLEPGAVARSAHAAGAIPVGAVPSYAAAGAAVSFDVRGGRPEILVNVQASRQARCEFTSQLLEVARIVETGDQ